MSITQAEMRALADTLREAGEKATEGPWEWRNSGGRDPRLMSRARGHYVVMAFERMGMQGAQPVFRDPADPRTLRPAGKDNLYDYPDAALIPLLRNNLPTIISALERAADASIEIHEASE